MKQIVLLSLLALGLMVTVGANQANATEITDTTEHKSNTAITIIDGNGDPENPTSEDLRLDQVPTGYNFSTVVNKANYEINSGTIDGAATIDVFNNYQKRDWSVKATVKDNAIKRSETESYSVTSFKVNDVELIGTGATGIVAKNKDQSAENTGTVSIPINKISISFQDNKNSLKVGNDLTGEIDYVIYNTANAS